MPLLNIFFILYETAKYLRHTCFIVYVLTFAEESFYAPP